MKNTFRLATVFLFIALVVSVNLHAQEARKILIQGKVVDSAGTPIEDFPVGLIVEREVINVSNFSKSVTKRKVFTTKTDKSGEFYFTWEPDDYFNRFYVNYYVSKEFDDVRFLVPEEPKVDISNTIGKGRNYTGQLVINYHHEWFRVRDMIDSLGPESDKGKVLRKWGLYERETIEEMSGTKYTFWWYYTKGKSFKFVGEKLAKEFTYRPLKKYD